MPDEKRKNDQPSVYIVDEMPNTLDKPRFDFSNVSYKQGRESSSLQVRIQHLAKRLEAAEPSDDIETLLTQFNALMDQQEMHIFTAVEYVPQAWLISGAPLASEIDWSDHDNLKWLRSDKFQTLAKAKAEAQNNPN